MSPEIIAVGAIASFALNIFGVAVAIYKLGGAVTRFELIGRQQALEIASLKDAVKEVSILITGMALQGQRLDNISGRMGRAEVLIDDLRRGKGLIRSVKT